MSKIYLLPPPATIDTTLRFFQYKIFNNVLFLNKNLYTFGITDTALCSFHGNLEETPTHIFFDSIHAKCLWERLQTKFKNDLILLSLTPQTAILGLYNEVNNNYNLLSHILLIFKYYIYVSREKGILNIDILIANLMKIKKREKQISLVNSNKTEAYKKNGALQITFYQSFNNKL